MAPRKQNPSENAAPKRLARGFVKTGGILQHRIRKAGEKRGFSETKLLTHWAEIAGPATAAISRPVKVGYGREALGATLTLLTSGANAPIVQADSARILARVNASYGYAAISRIRITQTAEAGFAEDQAGFVAEPAPTGPSIHPDIALKAAGAVAEVGNPSLRSALRALGQNILSGNRN